MPPSSAGSGPGDARGGELQSQRVGSRYDDRRALGSGPACREEQVLAAGLEDELQAVVAVAIGGVGAGACGLEYTGRRDPEVLLAEHHRVRRCRQALGDLTTAGLPD